MRPTTQAKFLVSGGSPYALEDDRRGLGPALNHAGCLVSGGSPYSYKNAAATATAAASPSGRQTQAQRTASLVHNASSPCPQVWSSIRKLDLSTAQSIGVEAVREGR